MRVADFAASASIAAAVLVAAPAAQGADSYDAVNVELHGYIGVLTIETGGVDRVEVDYEHGEGLVDPARFDVRGDTLRIRQLNDNAWRSERMECRDRRDGREVRLRRGSYEPLESYGRLVIRAPEGAHVELGGGAVDGDIGDVGAASIGVSSCGEIVLGDVAEDAQLAVSGSGGITAGDVAGDASVAVSGSGDITVGAVGGDLSAAVNGSGEMTIGDVAGGANIAMNGSGDVRVASVGEDIDAVVRGSGDIDIDGGEVREVSAAIMGSGDVRFDGVAHDVSLSVMGSGDVYVAEVTGEVRSSAFGSGDVHIGQD